MMGAMLATLKGGVLWAVVAVILAVLGAVTYLASQSILSGSDVLTLVTLILTGVVGLTSAHVAGQTAAAAFNTPAPGPNVPPSPVTAPTPAPAADTNTSAAIAASPSPQTI